MKERKVENKPTVYYSCDTCGKESQWKEVTEQCEKSHTCKHESVYEWSKAGEDEWWFNVDGIDCRCKLCGKSLGFFDFNEIEDGSGLIGEIYKLGGVK